MDISEHTRRFVTKLATQLNRSFEIVMTALTTNGNPDPAADLRDGEIISLSLMTIPYSLAKIEKTEDFLPGTVDVDISDLIFLENLLVLNRRPDKLQWTVNSITNPQLKKLYYQTGKAEQLHVDKLQNLEELVCHMNQLTSLDLSLNPRLKHLNCQLNKISSLDLSMNPRLTHVNFQNNVIDVSLVKFPAPNEIAGLFMRGCMLKDSRLPLQFPYLKKLYLDGTHLTALDLQNNTLLTQFSVNNLQTEELDISNCTGLSDVNFTDCRIRWIVCNEMQSYTIKPINKKLKQKPTEEQQQVLKTFELHQQALSHNWDEGFAKLKKILKSEFCDLATARAIYWISRPTSFLKYKKASDVPSMHVENFKFINSLEKQLMEDTFSGNQISFDPSNFMGHDWTAQTETEKALMVRQIPDKLKEPLKGAAVTCFDLSRKIKIEWPF